MRSLKTILVEGIFGDIDDVLADGDKEIVNMLRSSIDNAPELWWAKCISDNIYDEIVQHYTEVPAEEKKGTRWMLVMPDKNSSFKPIMVATHKKLYRKPLDKEIYGTTASAMEKRLKNIAAAYKKHGINPGFVNTHLWEGMWYIMINYTKVDKVSNSDDWYTVGRTNYSTHACHTISFNPTTKEWAYGSNKHVPNRFIEGPEGEYISREWAETCDLLLKTLDKLFSRSNAPLITAMHETTLDNLKKCLTPGDPKDFKKNRDDWKVLGVFSSYWDREQWCDVIAVNKKDMTLLVQSKLKGELILTK